MKLIQHSSKVICMDANLSEETISIINSIREMANKEQRIYKYINTSKPNSEYTYEFFAREAQFNTHMENAIKQNKKIAVAITSRKKATYMCNYFKQQFPNKRVGLYTKESGDKDHFNDVNQQFSKLDLLIYTPTLTAGVSFEKKHFDTMYGFFEPRSCNAEICS